MTERKLTVETLEELLEFPALQKLDNWKRAACTAIAALEEAETNAAEVEVLREWMETHKWIGTPQGDKCRFCDGRPPWREGEPEQHKLVAGEPCPTLRGEQGERG